MCTAASTTITHSSHSQWTAWVTHSIDRAQGCDFLLFSLHFMSMFALGSEPLLLQIDLNDLNSDCFKLRLHMSTKSVKSKDSLSSTVAQSCSLLW